MEEKGRPFLPKGALDTLTATAGAAPADPDASKKAEKAQGSVAKEVRTDMVLETEVDLETEAVPDAALTVLHDPDPATPRGQKAVNLDHRTTEEGQAVAVIPAPTVPEEGPIPKGVERKVEATAHMAPPLLSARTF